MKTILLLAVCFICVTVFSASAFAQTGAKPPTTGKIVVLNSYAFGDEKSGITKYVTAVKLVNAEFAPVQKELETMIAKLTALAKEIDIFRERAGTVPVDPKVAQAKTDEAEKLQRDIKIKQEDAKARFEKRQQAVMAPIMQDIGKALTEFAKQNGYLLIFDIAKDEAGFLVAIGDDKADVTKDFITFYNAR